MISRRVSVFIVGVVLPLAGAAPTSAPEAKITITCNAATVKRTMFDRAHLTPEIPKLEPNEAALTRAEFLCGAAVDYVIVDQKQVGDHWHVTAKLERINVRTNLNDTIFLPQMAPVELRSHEEGHREMNEQVYKTAEAVAKKAAAHTLEKTWEADGADADAAGKAATDAAVNSLCEEFIQKTARRASHLGDIYDKITGHGRKPVMVANAIRLSYEEEQKEATTQP